MNIVSMIAAPSSATRARAIAGLCALAALSLGGCDKAKTGGAGGNADAGIIGAAEQQEIPAAFDTVARVISAQGHELAGCVAIADDQAKLACYAALGFKDKGDLADLAALVGGSDIMAGKRWQITAPTPGGADSFQGSAMVTFAQLPNEGPMAFRNSRVTLRCPAKWGGPSNQQWSASIDVPFEMAYDSSNKQRGTMEVSVDGKPFSAVQFSRTSFNIVPDQAVAFRDAIVNAKALSAAVKTIDGKSGTMNAPLPASSTDGLKGYFAKYCA